MRAFLSQYSSLFWVVVCLVCSLRRVETKGDVTLVNLQRQLATPIPRNACFSHEFADMLHFWIDFKNFQRVAALQISQKIVRNGVLHWNDFSRNIVSLQVGVASSPV